MHQIYKNQFTDPALFQACSENVPEILGEVASDIKKDYDNAVYLGLFEVSAEDISQKQLSEHLKSVHNPLFLATEEVESVEPSSYIITSILVYVCNKMLEIASEM